MQNKPLGVNFINVFRAPFSYESLLCLEFGFEQTFVRKTRVKNVDKLMLDDGTYATKNS